jgi:hypothetical protein
MFVRIEKARTKTAAMPGDGDICDSVAYFPLLVNFLTAARNSSVCMQSMIAMRHLACRGLQFDRGNDFGDQAPVKRLNC